MADYSDHPAVRRVESLGRKVHAVRTTLMGERHRHTQAEFDQMVLESNIEYLIKTMRKMVRLIRNDSELVARVEFKGIDDEWLDFTMTDALLLKIEQLGDILEKKIEKLDPATRPRPAKPTREQIIAWNARHMNAGF